MIGSISRTLACFVLVTALTACASGETPRQEAAAGERLYKVSCAACHGADARGTGPVAPLLTVPVPDLTRIAQRRGGEFPELEIFRIIDGQSDLAGHGPRHMPVWGYEFFGDDADDEVAHRRATDKVDRLVAYLRSIQRTD
jgi:mono/diheme cytochrome c family protein